MFTTIRRTAYVRAAILGMTAATIAVGPAAAPANAEDGFPSCFGFNVGATIESEAGNPTNVGPRAVLLAGTRKITLENLETGTTSSVRTAGAARTSPGPNGSTIFTTTGPSILLLFPSDPGGKATTLYQGRLVFNQSADGVTTILSSTGGTVDLCAALGG
jgi:hypothetical protein